jgi:hypothetical protein
MSEEETIEIPEEAYEGDVVPRDLGPVHKVLLEIYHPQDENSQYVVKVKNPDTDELYGTLFTSEEHTASGFGNFISHHIKTNDI